MFKRLKKSNLPLGGWGEQSAGHLLVVEDYTTIQTMALITFSQISVCSFFFFTSLFFLINTLGFSLYIKTSWVQLKKKGQPYKRARISCIDALSLKLALLFQLWEKWTLGKKNRGLSLDPCKTWLTPV